MLTRQPLSNGRLFLIQFPPFPFHIFFLLSVQMLCSTTANQSNARFKATPVQDPLSERTCLHVYNIDIVWMYEHVNKLQFYYVINRCLPFQLFFEEDAFPGYTVATTGRKHDCFLLAVADMSVYGAVQGATKPHEHKNTPTSHFQFYTPSAGFYFKNDKCSIERRPWRCVLRLLSYRLLFLTCS